MQVIGFGVGALPNVLIGFTADILLSWLCLVLLGVASKLMGCSGISEHMHCLSPK